MCLWLSYSKYLLNGISKLLVFTLSEWLSDSSGYGSVPHNTPHAVRMYEANYSPNLSPKIDIHTLVPKIHLNQVKAATRLFPTSK